MKRRRLTRNEKLSATMQLQDIEVALSHVLFETLNCKIALADQDRLVWLAGKVREFRYKVEGYREIEDRGVRS